MLKEPVEVGYEVQRNIANLTLVKAFHDMGLPIKDLLKYHVEPISSYSPGFSTDVDSIYICRVVFSTIFPEAKLFKQSTFIDADWHYSGEEPEKVDYVKECIVKEFNSVDYENFDLVETDFLLLEDDFSKIDLQLIKRQIYDLQKPYYNNPLFSIKAKFNEGDFIEDSTGMRVNFELSNDKKKLLVHYEYASFAYSCSFVAIFLLYLVRQMQSVNKG